MADRLHESEGARELAERSNNANLNNLKKAEFDSGIDARGYNKMKGIAKNYRSQLEQERYDRGIDNSRRDAQLHGIENERNAYKKGADKAFEAAHKYKDSLHKWKVGTGIAAGTAALGLGAYALYKHHKAKKEAEKAALEAQYA
jgi:hypothetical protein